MITQGVVYKVKEGKLARWKEWCRFLMKERYDEAKETLEEEKNKHELFVTFEADGTHYVVGMGVGENLPAIPKPINYKHKLVKEDCLEYVGKLENLLEVWNM